MFDILKKKNVQDKMVTGPLLSIVIPLYNHEKFIAEAIDSVVNQTYQSWELIIIDDGSKDNSVKIARSYHDDRITVIEQENAGAHNAINRGLQMAKGEYLAILNSDDVYEKKRFEVMISKMEQSENLDFLCSYITIINDKGKKMGVKEGWKNMEPWTLPNREKSLAVTDDFKMNLLVSNFTSTTSNFLFTRRLYDKIGGMRNLRFAHDWDFALRAAEVAECDIVEEPLMQYRVHGTNTISSNRKWMLFEIAWMWAANLERFYNTAIFKDGDEDILKIVESINLQGNDKIFWMIKMVIEVERKKGNEHPEEVLLYDNELRNKMLEYVSE